MVLNDFVLDATITRDGSTGENGFSKKREYMTHASRRSEERTGCPLGESSLDYNSLKYPFLALCVSQTEYWPVPFSLDEFLANRLVTRFSFYIRRIYPKIENKLRTISRLKY